MSANNSDWSKRRIEPIKDDEDNDADAIREQLEMLHAQRSGGGNSKPADKLIDTFWRDHGHKQDQQAAWHVFYAGLDTHQKHRLWDEYHQVVSDTDLIASDDEPLRPATPAQPANQTDHMQFPISEPAPIKQTPSSGDTPKSKPQNDDRRQLLADLKQKRSNGFKQHIKPLVSALVAVVLFLGLNYNQLVIAQVKQYVSPGDSLQGPIILEPDAGLDIGQESKIIIPKINVDVPVVYDVTTYNEDAIQQGLERGVVHYGRTALPGEAGNNVIVGHSSNNFLNSGRYKFAFVLLDRLQIGDTFILHYEGIRYVYKVTKKEVVEPTDFSLIQPTAVPTTTLVTCTPPGTSWHRLIVQAEQISPEPSSDRPANDRITPTDEATGEPEVVPGNAPSLWEQWLGGLFGD